MQQGADEVDDVLAGEVDLRGAPPEVGHGPVDPVVAGHRPARPGPVEEQSEAETDAVVQRTGDDRSPEPGLRDGVPPPAAALAIGGVTPAEHVDREVADQAEQGEVNRPDCEHRIEVRVGLEGRELAVRAQGADDPVPDRGDAVPDPGEDHRPRQDGHEQEEPDGPPFVPRERRDRIGRGTGRGEAGTSVATTDEGNVHGSLQTRRG